MNNSIFCLTKTKKSDALGNILVYRVAINKPFINNVCFYILKQIIDRIYFTFKDESELRAFFLLPLLPFLFLFYSTFY